MDPQPPAYQPAPTQTTVQVQSLPNPGLAVALELITGIMAQTFGIGNLYAGNTAVGIFLMLGYWASCVVNFLLCFLLIGFITWPLTWIAFMIFSPILANNAAQARATHG